MIKFNINPQTFSGSPFKFHVDSLSSGYVTAYGPGLIYGVCGEPAHFTISTKGTGAGGLSLAVEGPSKAEISCHDNKDGTVSVSYLPTAPGEYKISVKFSDKDIKGSPYNAKITGILAIINILQSNDYKQYRIIDHRLHEFSLQVRVARGTRYPLVRRARCNCRVKSRRRTSGR